ncbi:MAG: hypothetical protein H6726_24055 [Sandaracinaceae bacterium]|nr:hypothetical protein [Myxococcales bacterium]MCB9660740.1 hypothetical protein [Sandaracinaceae bacterium]
MHDFLTRLLRYTYHTANGDMDAVHRVLHTTLTPTMESHMGTLAEQLIARGVQQGRAEGELSGQREMLARMLALKFGELSHAARARIEGASHDELATYSLRVLTADTIDAVFG